MWTLRVGLWLQLSLFFKYLSRATVALRPCLVPLFSFHYYSFISISFNTLSFPSYSVLAFSFIAFIQFNSILCTGFLKFPCVSERLLLCCNHGWDHKIHSQLTIRLEIPLFSIFVVIIIILVPFLIYIFLSSFCCNHFILSACMHVLLSVDGITFISVFLVKWDVIFFFPFVYMFSIA